MSREDKSNPAMTISFTPLALAPGVLNTTIPFSAHFSSGILLTPAPALAIASKLSDSSKSWTLALLTNTASASPKASTCVYLSSNIFNPISAIGFRQFILNIFSLPNSL
ncbi:hypothetical protein D3C73_1189270 [compost metagenome]